MNFFFMNKCHPVLLKTIFALVKIILFERLDETTKTLHDEDVS